VTRSRPPFPPFSQTAKSAVLVLSGLARLARRRDRGEGTVLTFHGLRQDDQPVGVGDASLHLPVSRFRAVCQQLAANDHVMPLLDMVRHWRAGERLPPRAVALTFDDGYASNYHLGFPVLRELRLPAMIFLATGFLDGTQPLWFQQVDLALAGKTGSEGLAETLQRLKKLPEPERRAEVAKLTQHLDDRAAPAVTRPMTWAMAREMRDSGLIDFGGHTDSHPILSRCSLAQQQQEIQTCRQRLTEELGRAPTLFAYPNGGPEDFTAETQQALQAAGFDAAFTMMSGRLGAASSAYALPRYGSPESIWEAEATVSGAFEMLRAWRGGGS
jgi:peptidoglycan/xylan/chitin deacetylase (PgdA/CDA1 family)